MAGKSGYKSAVKQWRGVLDPGLKGLPAPEIDIEPPFDKPSEQEQEAAQLATQVEEDDEDLKGDLQRYRVQKKGQVGTTGSQEQGNANLLGDFDELSITSEALKESHDRQKKDFSGLHPLLSMQSNFSATLIFLTVKFLMHQLQTSDSALV